MPDPRQPREGTNPDTAANALGSIETEVESRSAPAQRRPDSELDLAGRRRLDAVARALTGADEQPETLGRFEIRRMLGEGAFGEVYLGFDPDLQRPVALKLLKQSATADSLRRLRLEAQAMAALEHPALLTVFEIGTAGHRNFVAMELAEEGTLREWVDAQPRSFAAIAAQVERAARALAVAHQAGFVHRDVKPTNILVGNDGLARVSDFGLVHIDPVRAAEPAEGTSTTTAMAGTPAYMAPELFDGSEPTAFADQYALGVTLHELVYGTRPVKRPPALEDIVCPPLRELGPRRVPPWLRAVITRSLKFDPAERFVDMLAMADALRDGVEARGKRVRRGVLGMALVTAAGLGWAVRSDDGPRRCEGSPAKLAEAWNDARRDQVRAAITSVDAPYAQTLWQSTASALDAYGGRWQRMHREACEAATLRGERSPELMDRQMACLDRALGVLRAASAVLAVADASTVDHALDIVPDVSELLPCEDLEALQAAVPPPTADEREEVRAIQALLAEARAEHGAGHFVDAMRLSAQARERAAAVHHGPTKAEAAVTAGTVLRSGDRPDEAGPAFREGLELGAAARQWTLVGTALVGLLNLAEQGEVTVDSAALESLARGLVSEDPVDRAELQLSLSQLKLKRGESEAAEAEVREALATLQEHLGRDDRRVGRAFNRLAGTLDARGAFLESAAALRSAIEIHTTVLGATHPTTLSARRNLFVSFQRQGAYDKAEAEIRALVEISEEVFGPDHVQVARLRSDLAVALDETGRSALAEAEQRAALRILEAHHGQDAPVLGPNYETLAVTILHQGRRKEAVPWLIRAVAAKERFVAETHPQLAQMRANLAQQLLFEGRRDEALVLAEKAWNAVKDVDVQPRIAGVAAYALAVSLYGEDPVDNARARELAQRAAEILQPQAHNAGQVAIIETWLREHPG